MTLEIKSYIGIDDLRFDHSTKDDAIAYFGKPTTERNTRLGNLEYEYSHFILRFCPLTYRFIECTLLPYAEATVNDISVTWDKDFLKKICQLDTSPKNSYGFIILPKYGVAMTGMHDSDESQLAITVFRKNELNDFLEGSNDFDCTSL